MASGECLCFLLGVSSGLILWGLRFEVFSSILTWVDPFYPLTEIELQWQTVPTEGVMR